MASENKIKTEDIKKEEEEEELSPVEIENRRYVKDEKMWVRKYVKREYEDARVNRNRLYLDTSLIIPMWTNWFIELNLTLHRHVKPDIADLTAEQLNYLLTEFFGELLERYGTPYKADSIYFFALRIQLYLFENCRTENIFYDGYFGSFIDTVDAITRQHSDAGDEFQFLQTNVVEEHLWESRQLGVDSPYALLNTIMYFNTKYLDLMTLEDHMKLTFTKFKEHWKRFYTLGCNNENRKAFGYCSTKCTEYDVWASIDYHPTRVKKINDSRCAVKLFNLYLAKCPSAVKNSDKLFYLIPEHYSLPDSGIWYMPTPLSEETTDKMLRRIKMVKEANFYTYYEE